MPKDYLRYIRQLKKEGYSDREIQINLEQAGWAREDIDIAFYEVSRNFLHMHMFRRHIPLWLASLALILVLAAILVSFSFIFNNYNRVNNILSINGDIVGEAFTYGSWPALENPDFFKTVKAELIENQEDFIESDLSLMVLRLYEDGEVVKEVPIISKGREGSWWETPAGLYSVQGKEENHFSSFGQVNMPYSMQFQGNFFIHGWPTYPDGSDVPEGFSGGCIRLATEDAAQIFALAKKDIPVLIYEDSFSVDNKENDKKSFNYTFKLPNISADSFIAADLENNFVFNKKDSSVAMSIASVTKLMSALVAVEYINVERSVIVNESMIIDTSIPRLKLGESFTVLDLLSILLMESSNEAAKAITAPIGEERFIELMNIKADSIGMQESLFVDTSGVQSENISTAEDLFMLAKYLYYNRSFVLHMSVGEENRIVYGESRFFDIKNLNEIIETTGMVGGKTGLSSAAKESMLAVYDVEIDGEVRPIAIIVLGSENSKQDIESILQYIKSNYIKK